MFALLLLQEGKVLGTAHTGSDRGDREEACVGEVQLPQGRRGKKVSLWCCSRCRQAPLLCPILSSLGPARVVNVLIAALMSCKWDPTSRYIRVMSSHLTNGDLIELLIGCLFPPRFMTPRPGQSGEGGVRGRVSPGSAPGPRLARQPFQGHRLSTFLQGKINSLRLLCLY